MTTSGSTDFTLTRDQIISEALEQLGAIGIGETPSAADVTSCSRSLNMMIKAWETQGVHLWTNAEQTVSLVVGTESYNLSPKPAMIKQIRLVNSAGIERPVRIISRSDYNLIPNKEATGKINQVCYDDQLTTGTIYVWPSPDDATDTLKVTYNRKIEDFDASSDNPDLPQYALLAITLNLAVQVAPKYGYSLSKLNPDLINNANIALAEMTSWDVENARVRVVPAADFGA